MLSDDWSWISVTAEEAGSPWLALEGFVYISSSDEGGANADHQHRQQQYENRWNGLQPLHFDASSDWDAVVDDVGVWLDASTRPDAATVCSVSGGTFGTPLWSPPEGESGGESASMRAYDAVWTLAYALNATLASGGSATDGAAVMTSLLRTDFEGTAGAPAKFDSVHVGEKIRWPVVHQVAKQSADALAVARMVESSSSDAVELAVDAAAWNVGRTAATSGGGGGDDGLRWLGESHGDGRMPTLDHSVFYADESFWGGGDVKYEMSLRNAFGEHPRGNTTVEVCFVARTGSGPAPSAASPTAARNCNTHAASREWLSGSNTGRIHGVLASNVDVDASIDYQLQTTFFTAVLTDPLRSRAAVGPTVLLTQQTAMQYPRRPLPSVTEGDITLGILTDASAPATKENWAAEMWQMYLLAFDQVNKDPTVLPNLYLGYTMFNSKGDSATAQMYAKKMLRARPENRLVGVLGASWTTSTVAAAETLTQAMVPIISGGSDYIALAKKGTKYSYLFRTTFSKTASIELAAEYMKRQGWSNVIMIASWNDQSTTAVNADIPFANKLFESRGIQRSKHYFYSKTVDRTPTGECGQPVGTYFHPGCAGDICATAITDTDYGRACASEAEADAAYHRGIDATLRAARATGIRIILFDLFSAGGSLMAQDLYESAARVSMLDVSQYTWLSYEGSSVLFGSPWATMDGFVLVKDSDEVKSDAMRSHDALYKAESTHRRPEDADVFDAVTGFPDFSEYSTRTSKYSTLWDGNGDDKVNDVYGKFAYDAVWVFARALDAQIKAGVTPYDGAALRARILATDFPMITGYPPTFHPVYQDRMKPNNVYEVQNLGSTMKVLVEQDSVGNSAVVANPMHSTPNISCETFHLDGLEAAGLTRDGGVGVAQLPGCSQVNDSAYADNFKDGTLCDVDSGAFVVVDTTPFDGVVSCISKRTAITVTNESKATGLIAGVVTSVAVLALVIAAAIAKQIKEKNKRNQPTDFRAIFAEWQSKSGAAGQLGPSRRLSNVAADDYDAPREVRRSALTLVDQVGSGQFGAVWKGMLDESATGGPPSYLVAAKTIIDSKVSPEATRELEAEALVMAQVSHHPNLVSLVGVVTRADPFILIISYCEYGSLLSLLRKRAAELSPLSFRLKLKLGLHTAKGMEHLASLHFIHRDLAARNVLVATGMVGQVADFGLSRGAVLSPTQNDNSDSGGGVSEEYYRSQAGVFPIRWTAPEAMETLRFSSASDVWSLAILMVEMFQDGAMPYGHIKHTADVMQQVMGGLVHERPEECTPTIYENLRQCWSLEPRDRPNFTTVVAMLSAAGPAFEERKSEYKKENSAHNEYADFGNFADGGVGGVTGVDSVGIDDPLDASAASGGRYPIMESHRRHAPEAAVPAQSSEGFVYEVPTGSGLPMPVPVPGISKGAIREGQDKYTMPATNFRPEAACAVPVQISEGLAYDGAAGSNQQGVLGGGDTASVPVERLSSSFSAGSQGRSAGARHNYHRASASAGASMPSNDAALFASLVGSVSMLDGEDEDRDTLRARHGYQRASAGGPEVPISMRRGTTSSLSSILSVEDASAQVFRQESLV